MYNLLSLLFVNCVGERYFLQHKRRRKKTDDKNTNYHALANIKINKIDFIDLNFEKGH